MSSTSSYILTRISAGSSQNGNVPLRTGEEAREGAREDHGVDTAEETTLLAREEKTDEAARRRARAITDSS